MRYTSIAAVLIALAFARTTSAGQQPPAPQANGNATNANAVRNEPTAKANVDPNQYRIAPGDKLRIEVYKDQQLSQSVQVRPDGKITLPLIGDIDAAGEAPVALRDRITESLKEYVTKPTVTVILVEAAASLAYVMGEVNRPGSITLQGGQVSVLQALALAGGLKDFADEKNIRVLRQSNGSQQTIPFNYKDAIRGGAPFYLRPGDTVVVPD
ncbi:MAG TPA: polysaccharide biosynthesis/export family protein [Vicinamibacterales bacterium]|jgi:polysaccharide export outer membrane protein